jgi:hypothetical protein
VLDLAGAAAASDRNRLVRRLACDLDLAKLGSHASSAASPAFTFRRAPAAAAPRDCLCPERVVSRLARWWLLPVTEQKSAHHSGALVRFVAAVS